MVTPTSLTNFLSSILYFIASTVLFFSLIRSHFFLRLLPPLAQRVPSFNIDLLFAELNLVQPAG